MTRDELNNRLKRGHKGTRAEYHRGYLPTDKLDSEDVRLCAQFAWNLSELGYARLYQKRHGPFDYSYFLVLAEYPSKSRRMEAYRL